MTFVTNLLFGDCFKNGLHYNGVRKQKAERKLFRRERVIRKTTGIASNLESEECFVFVYISVMNIQTNHLI